MHNRFLYTILFSVFYFTGYTQPINFTDPVFKAKLLEANSSLNNIAYDLSNNITTIDINNDGEIEPMEAVLIGKLFIGNSGIHNLGGIEFFTNLTLLGFNNNYVSSVDVSALTHLEQFGGGNNQLNTLNLNGLINLKQLFCFGNQISTLNLTGLTNLELVYCNNNLITSLDFSSNPVFKELECANNPLLTSIIIKNGYQQLFGNQTLYNQCWNNCPNLTTICADNFEITALQNDLANCNINTNGINITSNCGLSNEEFINYQVKVFPNPTNGMVNIISDENLKTVSIFDFQGRVLLIDREINTYQAVIDLSAYSNGIYFVKVECKKGSNIDKIIKE